MSTDQRKDGSKREESAVSEGIVCVYVYKNASAQKNVRKVY